MRGMDRLPMPGRARGDTHTLGVMRASRHGSYVLEVVAELALVLDLAGRVGTEEKGGEG